MPKLVINPDTGDSWEIQLKPGAHLLGRSPATDFQLDHESVSDMHCQVVVTETGTILTDLGSAAGTFVDGEPVRETPLRGGQQLRIGNIVARFDTDPEPSLSTAGSVTNSTPPFCRNHPKAQTQYWCRTCSAGMCELCVDRRGANSGVDRLCRACGSVCDRVSRPGTTPETRAPFRSQLAAAMAYPFAGDGIILLASGAVFFYIIQAIAARTWIIGLLLLLAGSAYLISYLQKILLASAAGEARMPDWPDFSDLGELLSPIFQFLSTIAISFGPAILVRAFAPEDSSWKPWALWTAVGAGCLYFPMAWIAVTLADSVSALNPLAIVPSILRIPGSYLPAVGILSAIVLLDYFGNSALSRLLPIPILPSLLSEFIGLYLATVEMRILGLVYWHNREKLAWFER